MPLVPRRPLILRADEDLRRSLILPIGPPGGRPRNMARLRDVVGVGIRHLTIRPYQCSSVVTSVELLRRSTDNAISHY